MIPAIHIVPILDDNYCYILEGAQNQCLIVDPGEANPVKLYINKNRLKPLAILNTHHHGDHTGGNLDFGLPVIAPEAEKIKIPGFSKGVSDAEIISLGGIDLRVIETPGHTKGHVVFYCEAAGALFSGDTLFSMGCGRLFEGTAQDMYDSLQKIKNLPPDTKIYCGHEYTASNARFAAHIEPDNQDIAARMADIKKQRDKKEPTIPVTLEMELKTNPFLRAADVDALADIRKQKDNF